MPVVLPVVLRSCLLGSSTSNLLEKAENPQWSPPFKGKRKTETGLGANEAIDGLGDGRFSSSLSEALMSVTVVTAFLASGGSSEKSGKKHIFLGFVLGMGFMVGCSRMSFCSFCFLVRDRMSTNANP